MDNEQKKTIELTCDEAELVAGLISSTLLSLDGGLVILDENDIKIPGGALAYATKIKDLLGKFL